MLNRRVKIAYRRFTDGSNFCSEQHCAVLSNATPDVEHESVRVRVQHSVPLFPVQLRGPLQLADLRARVQTLQQLRLHAQLLKHVEVGEVNLN